MKEFLDKCKQKANPKEIFTESCIICLEDFKSDEEIKALENLDKNAFEKMETSILECGHKFHRKCISDWLKKEENCPICRMKFNLKPNENNTDNKSSNDFNFDFSQILENILRVQSENNFLNRTEVRRIKRIYYPENTEQNNNSRRNNYNYSQNNNNYSQYYSYNSKDNTTSNSNRKEKKSYKSHNEGSGGATSDW